MATPSSARDSNVTSIGSHDSFAFSEDPFARASLANFRQLAHRTIIVARDQEVDIPTQLGLRIRLLQAQAHMNNGVLHFCHTSCARFDDGAVVDYLKNVKTFPDANPNEALTLLFTNPEGASVSTVWKPAFDDAGISAIAFIPPSLPVKQSDWPTLGSMIDSGKRVVVFLDAGADGPDAVDFILPEFAMIWETSFSVANASFPCSINRIHGTPSAADHMRRRRTAYLRSSPTPRGARPSAPGGRAPNFVLIDFVNLGNAFAAADQLNGLSGSMNRTDGFGGSMNSTNTTSSSGGSSTSNSAGGPPRPRWGVIVI
ncbi:PLC-like phosphodiesterase [Mycena sp. CBHHK59/15]|nr:PLC-like phosphodiesterase [Mycena sp. CBHHK59/15]